jgi:nucleotide-binding universal stress UspA family protein
MDTIVVGVDGSKPSMVAVDWVAERAAQIACRVQLVRVDSPVVIPEETEDFAFAEAEGRLLDVAPNTEVTSARVRGRMPEALLEAAAHADLLVVGEHRRRPVRAALSGWLPLRVASRATMPVVIVPDDWTFTDGAVLVGLDDDDSSAEAIRFAARDADATGADLLVVHAWQMPTPELSGSVAILASPIEERARHQLMLEAACTQVARAFPQLRIRKGLVRDSPAGALLAAAEGASLVVLGTHHRGVLAGAFLGSVGQDMLVESRVPACIVPAPTSEG